MPDTTHSERALIVKFLPHADFAAAREICIEAPAAVVYERLLATDFYTSWIVRLLMSLRTGRRIRQQPRPAGDLRQRFERTGFAVLAERPNEEVVIGVAGKFWRPDGGRHLNLRADDFLEFSRPGEAKAAWNFRLKPGKLQGTVLSTETRIACFGRAARWKFGCYWALIAPFSSVIRKAILRRVKAEAELAVGRKQDMGRR